MDTTCMCMIRQEVLSHVLNELVLSMIKYGKVKVLSMMKRNVMLFSFSMKKKADSAVKNYDVIISEMPK